MLAELERQAQDIFGEGLTDREAAEEIDSLPSDDREFLRDVARNDLYILSKGILHRPDLNPDTHGAFIRFVQNSPKLRRLGLMPRVHLKTTVATIDDAVRLVLKDPNERMLIASETMTQAKKILREIKGHFENNRVLQSLFPELIPEKFSGPGVDWSTTQATINRSTAYGESSWMAAGVGSALVGYHFTRIKNDDLIGLEAARSPARMQEAKDWVDNIEPLLTDQKNDIIDWIGTRWSRADLYQHIMETYGAQMSVFTREAIEGGKIIFPQKHTWEEYKRLMEETPNVWYAQYCNNPVAAGKADFPYELIKTFVFSADGDAVEFREGSEVRSWPIRDLDIVITVDPNSGSVTAPDLAAVIVSAMSPESQVFVLQTWSDRCSPSQLVDRVFDLACRWKPRVVGIEKAGQQNTDHYFRLKMEGENRYFNVTDLLPKNRMKEERVRGYLEPTIRSGRLYLLPGQQILRKQLRDFPDNILVDELDALAYGQELWRRPMRSEDIKRGKKHLRLVLAKRSRVTGY